MNGNATDKSLAPRTSGLGDAMPDYEIPPWEVRPDALPQGHPTSVSEQVREPDDAPQPEDRDWSTAQFAGDDPAEPPEADAAGSPRAAPATDAKRPEPLSVDEASGEAATGTAEILQANDVRTIDEFELIAPNPNSVEPPKAANEFLAEVRALRRDFELKVKFDESRDRTIEAQREELQEHRLGLQLTLLRPMTRDLISICDELSALARHHAGNGDPGSGLLVRTLESFAASVEDTLARSGFEPYVSLGDTFDGSRQRADRMEATSDATLAGRIHGRLGKGFEYNGRVFRPERVSVYELLMDSSPGAETLLATQASGLSSDEAEDM